MKTLAKTVVRELSGCRGLPLFFFIVVPVLVVRTKFIAVAPDAVAFWTRPILGDTRSWWKAIFVTGIGAWMFVHTIARLASGWRPVFRRYGALTAIAMLCTLVSAWNSDFPRTAWLGYTSLYEGAWVLLAYLIAAWYAAEMTESPGLRLWLVRLIGGVGLFEAVHGIFEGFGCNLWMTAAGRWLMGTGDNMPIYNFAGTNMAYGTVFQPNHYGMLMTMLAMLALGMIAAEAGMKWRVFWSVDFVLCVAAVVFSNSRTALAVCAVLFVAYMVVCLIGMLRKRQGSVGGRRAGSAVLLVILVGCVTCLVAIAAGATGAGRFGEAVRGLGKRIAGSFTPGRVYRLESAEPQGDAIALSAGGVAGKLIRKGPTFWVAQRGGREQVLQPLRFVRTEGGWSEAGIPGLAEADLRVADGGAVVLRVDDEYVWFFTRGDALYTVDHKGCLYGELSSGAVVRFGGLERYLGGRGQTWGRALALVAQRPWFGAGPGSFALVFPNHEVLMKQRYLDNLDEDKGHGVWASFLVQLGIAGVLSYSLLFGYVMYRRPWKNQPLGMSLLLGMFAYLLAAVTNDSTVGVTPLFYILIGLALSQTRTTE